MKYLSVCSGVEAATVAWHHMGWQAAGFSEIEKFPSEVLAHHYPTVTNFGDMTKYKEWNLNDPIGLLVGGTPCQSFSVAGLRKGLDDPRGNLALTYLGILDHFRPKWCVWENVPGVLSSGGGRDFGAFLGALGELGYGWAYRVLDAQNFGVAQRRRRVFVVGHLGDWKPAAEVLFESESLRGDIKKGRSEKQNTTRGFIPSVANTLQTTCNDYSRADGFNMIAFENSRRDTLRFFDNVSNTLQAAAGSGGGNVPCVAIQGNLIGRDKGGPQGIGVSGSETMYTLTKADVHGVAFGWQNSSHQGMSVDTISPTLDKSKTPATLQNMAVRRLTPVECERLQGFPDNYTNIPKAADGNRYKALGNSMAVPVMRWIGERINQYEQRGMEKHL
jgi:DNA (cytosine-5)-methyltransferase 1